MGASQSVEIPGGGNEGYHVLRVRAVFMCRRKATKRIKKAVCEKALFLALELASVLVFNFFLLINIDICIFIQWHLSDWASDS